MGAPCRLQGAPKLRELSLVYFYYRAITTLNVLVSLPEVTFRI